MGDVELSCNCKWIFVLCDNIYILVYSYYHIFVILLNLDSMMFAGTELTEKK